MKAGWGFEGAAVGGRRRQAASAGSTQLERSFSCAHHARLAANAGIALSSRPFLPTQAGQAWAGLGAYEAAEAALGRAQDAAQALLPLCFERRGRSAQHQDAAALVLQLLLERLAVALQLGQQVGAAQHGWLAG